MTTSSIEDFLGGYQSPRRSVTITQRADLLDEHGRLQRALQIAIRDDLSSNKGAQAPRIRRELEQLEDTIRASEFEFTFEAMESNAYSELKAKHYPRPSDRKNGLDFNGDTFPPALIAASSAAPEISLEQAERLCSTLSEGQLTKLWNCAIGVNMGADDAPKSVMPSGRADESATSSSTADPEGSPAASSSDVS